MVRTPTILTRRTDGRTRGEALPRPLSARAVAHGGRGDASPLRKVLSSLSGAARQRPRAHESAGCCAGVTERKAQPWHSGPACGALRHRKPAAVTHAGYAYCQLRDTELSVQFRHGHGPRSEKARVIAGLDPGVLLLSGAPQVFPRPYRPNSNLIPRCLILPEAGVRPQLVRDAIVAS
jgi:hypothetical protein